MIKPHCTFRNTKKFLPFPTTKVTHKTTFGTTDNQIPYRAHSTTLISTEFLDSVIPYTGTGQNKV